MIDSNAPDLAHKRLSFLAEASHILASSLDVAVTLQQAARLTIPSLADACVIVPTVRSETVTPHAEAFQGVVWHLLVSHPSLKAVETKWESTRKAA